MQIEDIFDGEWQASGEFLIRCPVCGDNPTHNHCFINLKKKTFYCHYQGCTGRLGELIKEHKDVDLEPRLGITEKKKYPPVDFNQFNMVTGIEDSNDRLAMAYLKKREISKDDIELYSIGYCTNTTNRYYGRIILPITENEEIVCLSARSFLPFIKPSYLFPHFGETICTAGEVIWGYDYAQAHGAVVLVEGVFDAMAVNRKQSFGLCGLALLNKAMTKAQLNKLLKLDKRVGFMIMLDADAYKDSLKIARKLFNYGRLVYVCSLSEGDPASVSKEKLNSALEKARIFDDELEMEELL